MAANAFWDWLTTPLGGPAPPSDAVFASVDLTTGESFLDPHAPANTNLAPSDADVLKAASAFDLGPVSNIQHQDYTSRSVFGVPASSSVDLAGGAPHPSNLWLYAGIGTAGLLGLVYALRRA